MRGAWRIVLAGCLAELATVTLIVLTITAHNRLAGSDAAGNEAFTRTIAARLGPAAGTLFVFFFALWAASAAGLPALWTGALSGAVAAALTIPALLSAPSPSGRLYGLSIALKVAAGLAAGAVAERRARRRTP
jgi:hypothetical protein